LIAGSNIDISNAMIPITTSSSMSVNPFAVERMANLPFH
jgi:hypothetical protein